MIAESPGSLPQKPLKFMLIFVATLYSFAASSVVYSGDEGAASHGPVTASETRPLTAEAMETAQPRMPILTDPSQLPPEVRDWIEEHDAGLSPTGFGSEGHPFTTKLASSTKNNRTPTHLPPWSGTGKLWMRFGTSWFVCTASVIKPGVLVTAAHCVHEYGQESAGWADQVIFDPARFGSASGTYQLPFGRWDAVDWWIPSVYFNGTDVCTTYGIVCENDIALVVLAKNAAGLYPGQVRGVATYNTYYSTEPYVSFSGRTATQITQLGYPVAFESGYKMIRTDSLGYTATPNNVIIGSDQTGGSSGGPWLINFGTNPSSTSSVPLWNHPNRVTAVTSWGYVADTFKVQGASRFDTNANFTTEANIDSLVNAVCSAYPDRC
jgi:V8-like Glu-specific endopeptidase